MNVITTSVLRSNLADTVNSLSKKKKYLLIAKKRKLTSAIVDIDFFEDLLALANPKYLKSIKGAREEFRKRNFVTHEEAFGEI